jgi:SAM-dependent methyltransferase
MPAEAPVVTDEIELLGELAPLDGARLLELGCGNADFARRLLARTSVASVAALEVDRIQHARNLDAPQHPGLTFHFGGAQDIPLADASVDGVLMMKSLHHVPVALLDRALLEIRRVLKPGGWLYVSEPVYAGAFNDIVKLFHDEKAVRAAAYDALQRAAAAGMLVPVAEREFRTPRVFRDYDDFVAKVVRATHSDHAYPDDVAAEVRARFEKHQTPDGAPFIQPMRVNLLRRPAA